MAGAEECEIARLGPGVSATASGRPARSPAPATRSSPPPPGPRARCAASPSPPATPARARSRAGRPPAAPSRPQLHQRGPHLVLHVQRLDSGGVRGARLDLADGVVGEIYVRRLERALADRAAAGQLDLADLHAAYADAAVRSDLDRRGVGARRKLNRGHERLALGRRDLRARVELEGAVAGRASADLELAVALDREV